MVQRLRILLCTPEYAPYGSGIANVVSSIRTIMCERGALVEVVAPKGGDITVGRLASRLPGMVGLALFWYGALHYSILHAREYDAMWYQQPLIVCSGMLERIKRPIVLTWHATYNGLYRAHSSYRIWFLVPYYFFAYLVEWMLLMQLSNSKAQVVATAVSPQAAEELKGNGFRPEVKVIPNASRFAGSQTMTRAEARHQLQRYGIELHGDDRVIISVGRITPGKRPLELLRFFKKLQGGNSNVKLLVVGSGVLLSALRTEASLVGGVYAPGFVPDKDLPAFYQAADLFMSFSPHEAFNLTAVEAATFGLPVALSDIQSHRWLLQSGRAWGMIMTSSAGVGDVIKLMEKGRQEPTGGKMVEMTWDSIADAYLKLINREVLQR